MDQDMHYPVERLLRDLTNADLSSVLTRRALLTICDTTFFRFLPLILGAIEHVGAYQLSNRDLFVSLIEALRIRVNDCRAIKLRFLLLTSNHPVSSKWNVTRVHRRDAYTLAHAERAEALSSLATD
eukprot:CAMPEP_0198352720 /NCGR_PEP_ID=MMETSP1450-20131203/108431_1 /TAXON_ID=753684 ORGANISM="Madagascaria erythrocladiodes, Strain CCMP3234" /NCGR_SAMPLE_ID=MMETSP1450 /ASSEMBLY_ACC=CAM_ASM_001115 /LENGTH=125 /DNA_ID=CAMNT_0044058785 /DNA_START=116 /DNA_END=490 /DNA_ORIENTATION=+